MSSRWRYRVASIVGTALLVAIAIAIVNEPIVQQSFSEVPYFGRPAPTVLSEAELLWAISTAVVVTLVTMWPLFKPQPRRILDTFLETQRRVLLAMVGLAALGYFNYTYRLPRSTVMLGTAVMLLTMPAYMVAIRRQPQSARRALLVGDDPAAMRAILDAAELPAPVLGYVAPSSLGDETFDEANQTTIERIGGLSRIEDSLVSGDVDTVLLGFDSPDRAEFFGTLATCHAHGINAKIHRKHVDSVLTARTFEQPVVDINLEPWDLQDRIIKRLFDWSFAAIALVVLSPVILLIAVAIKLDDSGPLFYSQERTAEFGDTFTVYKFRTMRPGGEETTPGDERDRITRVGALLRRTHLDEIPQLWAILTGQMSVVGPRATWTDEETHLEDAAATWRKRWFVKPGLTGLAQINNAGSTEPRAKLRYDLKYIRKQSFWVDTKIVVRQLWQVGQDVARYLASEEGSPSTADQETGEGTKPDADSGESVDEQRVVTDGSPTLDNGDRGE